MPLDSERHLARVQELTEALEALDDGHAREVAEDLVGAIVELYGEGLRADRRRARRRRRRRPGDPRAARARTASSPACCSSTTSTRSTSRRGCARRSPPCGRTWSPTAATSSCSGSQDGVARLRLVGPLRGLPGVGRDARAGHQGGDRRGRARPARASRSRASPPRRARGIAPSPGLLQIQMPDGGAPGPDADVDGARPRRRRRARRAAHACRSRGAELIVANVDGHAAGLPQRVRRAAAPGLGDAALSGEILTCARCGRGFDLPRAGRALGADAAPSSSRCRCCGRAGAQRGGGAGADDAARPTGARQRGDRRAAAAHGAPAGRPRPPPRGRRRALRPLRRALSEDHRHLLAVRRAADPLRLRAVLCDAGRRARPAPDRDAVAAAWTTSSSTTSCGRSSRSRSAWRSSSAAVAGGVVALYPSPAGATECELYLEAWNELVAREPGARRPRARGRGADRQPARRPAGPRDRADRPLLRAGRHDQGRLGRASRAAIAVAERRRRVLRRPARRAERA